MLVEMIKQKNSKILPNPSFTINSASLPVKNLRIKGPANLKESVAIVVITPIIIENLTLFFFFFFNGFSGEHIQKI